MAEGLDRSRPYFFVHVMKTAGLTFNEHIRRNFAPEEIFPGPDDPDAVGYWVIERLRETVAEPHEHIRLFHGHFPFFVTDLVPEAVTLSVLREPVARTVSLLEMRRIQDMPDKTIEEVYEDHLVFGREIHNHQTKIFSLREADDAKTWVHVIDLDRDRLDVARANLARLDLLGFQERFDDFLAAVRDRYGWRIDPIDRVNTASRTPAVSDAFRRRIAEDNPLDMELYDWARTELG